MFIPNSMNDLDKIVLENKNKLLLLYFGATWCGPCKVLKEKLKDDNLMSKYDKMISIYIDVDNENFSQISQTYKISSLPTQIITILKENQLLNIHKLEGFNWNKLVSMYEDSLKYLKSESETDTENSESESNRKTSDKKLSNNSSKESNNDSHNKSNDESNDESSSESS